MLATECIQQLENIRKSSKRWWKSVLGLAGGGFVLMLALIVLLPDFAGFIVVFGILFLGIGVFLSSFKVEKKKEKFRKLYKESFVLPMLEEQFSPISYMYNRGFEINVVKSFQLVELSNRFWSDDYLMGCYHGISFSHSEVEIWREIRTVGKKKMTIKKVPYFHGRMFSIDLPKKNIPPIRIYSKNFEHADRSQEGKPYNTVSSGNPTVDKMIDIMTATGRDISKFLTPQMEDLIMRLHKTYGNLGMNFTDGKLYLCFQYEGDTFDRKMDKPLDYQEERNRIQQEIQPMIDVLETLEGI